MGEVKSLETLRKEIQPAELMAVSKGQPIEAIERLYHEGQRDFGENYVQELVEKAVKLQPRCPELRWHFIGHLQSNKVKALLPWIVSLHSVHSVELAKEVSKRAATLKREKPLPIYLEVNIDQEVSKHGFSPDEVLAAAREIETLSGLELQGLMCVPSPEGGTSGEAFRRLRELEKSCRPHTRGKLSMGMSSDYQTALKEGSTCVRLGTVLFGPRTISK